MTFRAGINAFARLGGGLLNDDELCKAIRQRQTKLLNSKSRYSLWRIRDLLIGCFLLRK
jgi:hypothetical protein